TAWLGVYSQQITPELRDGLDYNGGGAVVTRVLPGSPAARAGIEKGDVIVRVGSADVDSPDALADAVRSSRAGRTTDVRSGRGGRRRTLNVPLGSHDNAGNDDNEDFDVPAPPPSEPPQMDREDSDTPAPPEAPEAPEAPRPRIERRGNHDFVMR